MNWWACGLFMGVAGGPAHSGQAEPGYRRRPAPLSRLGKTALAALVIGLSLDVLLRGLIPALAGPAGDFANFYTASRIVVDRQPLEEAYRDFTWFQKRMDQYGVGGQLGGFIPHPPPAAVVFIPLSGLDPVTAKRVWTALNLILCLVCIFLLAETSGLHPLLAGLILLSTGAGLRNNFLFGQLYLLLLASLLGGLHFVQKGRPVLAGLLLGSLVPVKYAAFPWALYFCWRRRWQTVISMGAVALAVSMVTVWLVGWPPFHVFWADVLPRHLAGEIQDPFASRLQSWGSLFRRLFIADDTLNPSPPLNSPTMYFLSKNIVFWSLATLSLVVLTRIRFQHPRHTQLFDWGWMALTLMLLSPGGATYHFLLLTIPTAFFASILMDQGRKLSAGFLVLLFAALNLPHYLWLEGLAGGWTTPFAYTRLLILLAFYGGTLHVFRDRIDRSRPSPFWIALPLALAGLLFWRQLHNYVDPKIDGARQLPLSGGEFGVEAGLIQTDPDIGSDSIAFCSMVRSPDGYAVFDAAGRRRTPPGRNFYRPDLAPDDSSLLLETIDGGSPEIWLEAGGSPALPIVIGSHPSWSPDGRSFVFERDGRIHLWEVGSGSDRALPIERMTSDVAFLPGGSSIAYCVEDRAGFSLRVFQLESQTEAVLLSSFGRISAPSGLPSGKGLLFAWEREGNRDIWAILTPSRRLVRITSHPAADDQPVWDTAQGRVIFSSDRGRGLGYRTLFWISGGRLVQ